MCKISISSSGMFGLLVWWVIMLSNDAIRLGMGGTLLCVIWTLPTDSFLVQDCHCSFGVCGSPILMNWLKEHYQIVIAWRASTL